MSRKLSSTPPPTAFNRGPAPSSAHHRLIGSSVEWIGTTGQGDDAKLLRTQLEQPLFAPSSPLFP
jgi:hypothetical protein